MALSIHFTNKNAFYYNDFLCKEGFITIGNEQKRFYASIEYWKQEDYEKQWREGIARIKNYSQTCLITEINNPVNGYFIEWWIIYKRKNKLYIKNQFLFNKIYQRYVGNKIMDQINCYEYIPSFSTKSINKKKAAVWIIDLPEELKNQYTNYQTGTYKLKKHRSIWAL